MTIAKLEAAARKAADHPELRWIFNDLPKGWADNPNALRRLLVACAENSPLERSPAYAAAFNAFREVETAYALRNKIGELYHNEKVRRAAAADGHDLAYYLANPSQIKLALRNPRIADVLGADLVERLGVTVIETTQFNSEHGIEAPPPPAEGPIPVDAAGRENEIATLRSKSVAGTISRAEDQRLNELYAARLAAGDDAAAAELASHKRALGIPDKARTGDGRFQAANDEYRQLVDKSLRGVLTPDEDRRLTEMSGEKAVQSGAISREDLQAEQEQ
jgi:hypothetical protein